MPVITCSLKLHFWDKPGNTCKKQKSFKDAQQLETQSKRERNNYVYYCHQIIKKRKNVLSSIKKCNQRICFQHIRNHYSMQCGERRLTFTTENDCSIKRLTYLCTWINCTWRHEHRRQNERCNWISSSSNNTLQQLQQQGLVMRQEHDSSMKTNRTPYNKSKWFSAILSWYFFIA